jgi:transglutaminase-like putative cysteine protease
MVSPNNPQLILSDSDRDKIRRLQAVRAIAAIGLTSFVAHLLSLGTSQTLLSAASAVGVLAAGLYLVRGNKAVPVVIIHLGALLALYLIRYFANLVISGAHDAPESDFVVYRISEHIFLIFYAYLICCFGTWLYWCSRHTVTFECLVFAVGLIWAMGGHRNYYLDAPQSVASLAWNLGLAPQHLLLGIGVLSAAVLGTYLALSTGRPLFCADQPVRQPGTGQRLVLFTSPFVLLALMVAFAVYVNAGYAQNLSRATNGVAQGSGEEGDSPLGFHSAIGKTKQPAALVRLESDYKDNPQSQMLYLREGALSKFNGREFVYAGASYDNDIPSIKPGQVFMAIQSDVPDNRRKITQSVYLLSDHRSIFGIDYPHTVRIIKNPDTERFKIAYQVMSHAPTTPLKELARSNAGSKDWSEETWAHYLRAPGSKTTKSVSKEKTDLTKPLLDEHGEDLRYYALAHKIAGDFDSPLIQAYQISRYLSKESIYTRAPGHQANEKGDPVAPYLFQEKKRGYCVHFAHAAVYMMRHLGIPARIGTGYLTDLSYAKDGHILLHLGDRHAWPEVYIEDQGWVVMDITPEQAENESVLVPDEKLLEELMSKIDPAEALVEPEPIEAGNTDDKSLLTGMIDRTAAFWMLGLLILTWLGTKLFMRFGYLLVPSGKLQTRLAYLAFTSLMTDLGYRRKFGETRQEYCQRLIKLKQVDGSSITLFNEQTTYAESKADISTRELSQAIRSAVESYDQHSSRWWRVAAFFSFRSIGAIGRL